MFLAGFLGREEQWREFVPKWKRALGPQRKFLHMHDLRWNKSRTKELLARLGQIPQECRLTPALLGVRFGDYEDLVVGTPSRFHRLFVGYLACVLPLALQILRVIPDNERIELVFEQQTPHQRLAGIALSTVPACFSELNKNSDGTTKLAKWSFVPKGSTIMCDPADYFAFALREAWTNPNSKKHQWCKSILSTNDGEGVGTIMSRQQIRSLIQSTYFDAELKPWLRGLNETGKRF